VETLLGRDAARSDRPRRRSHGPKADPEEGQLESQRFTELYRAQHQRIYQFACRRVGPEMATEVVAETFLVAWRKFADVPQSPLPWLYRVASYEIANQRRRQKRSDQLHVEMELLAPPASHGGPAGELPDLVAVAFDSLSPEDQEILRLAAWEQLSLVEGASVLECSVSAYRMRLHRARLRLGKRVNQERPDTRRDAGEATLRAVTQPRGLLINGAEVAL
jgi:RNA polymerase sigma-70 factor (ECF subfamily)